MVEMVVTCNGTILAEKIATADTFFSRLKGLLGKRELAAGEGLLLLRCPSIHCFFMKMTIDVVYLSTDMTVLGTETLAPWSIGTRYKETAHVLELAAGMAQVNVGETLELFNSKEEALHA